MKNRVHFVLVAPREPGNIGAAARAIKNMGFNRLELVDPPPDWIHDARPMACQAGDLLENATEYPDLQSAIAEKSLVVGTTRRTGKERGLFLPFQEGLERIRANAAVNPTAVLFGREPSGLTNEELESCGFVISIPTSDTFPSLNLAQSVLLTAYELFKLDFSGEAARPDLVGQDRLGELYHRLANMLERLDYSPQGGRDLAAAILRDLRRILGRAGLTDWELRMLQGLCSRIGDKIPGAKHKRAERPAKKAAGKSPQD